MENVVSKAIPANQCYLKLSYLTRSVSKKGVETNWRSVPVQPETWTHLIERLKNNNTYSFEESDPSTVHFSDPKYEGDFMWILFDKVVLREYIDKNKLKSEGGEGLGNRMGRDGAFFAYWNKTGLDLTRYQVLRRDDFFNNRERIVVPCVFYALYQLIPREDFSRLKIYFTRKNETEPDKLDWTCNTYNAKHLHYACKSYKIYCKLHFYDEYSVRPQKRISELGVPKNESRYQIELGLYKDHYFIFEKTEYTRYFIQHYEELRYVNNPYSIIGKRKSGTYQRDNRDSYKLNSLDLLIEMINAGLFKQMNFKDIYNLRMPLRDKYGNLVTDKTPLVDIPNLHYEGPDCSFYGSDGDYSDDDEDEEEESDSEEEEKSDEKEEEKKSVSEEEEEKSDGEEEEEKRKWKIISEYPLDELIGSNEMVEINYGDYSDSDDEY